MLLEVNDLSISYGKGNPVVHGVSFSVDKGKILAIIGESGSGKTTVLRAVGHILPRQGQVTGGHILFEGKESETKTIREKTSFIFQDSGAMLNPIRTIGTEFSEYLAAHGITGGEAEDRMTNLLSQVRLPDPAGILKSYPFELSGGMRQRVGIAMAMAIHPELILADEPTSALDVTNQAVVVREMMDVCARADTAIIVVTHNMALASYMADTILVMKDGNAVEYGSAEKVIYHPKDPYTKLLLAAVPDPGCVLS